MKLTGKKIAFIVAPKNFRDEEYFQPKVVLQSQGAAVLTFAKGDPEEMPGNQGGKARTDAKFNDLNSDDYDGLVFVGGNGAKIYFENKKIHKLIRQFIDKNKVIGAICIATTILAKAGVLENKQVTSTEDQKETIKSFGAKWLDQAIVVDGNIITANGPEAALKFGSKLAQMLG
jgi:protease I